MEGQAPRLARLGPPVEEKDVVPAEEKTVTARGTLSTKKLPASRSAEIYQDFVCGAAIRTARDRMAALPLRGAVVDVWTKILNTDTGTYDGAVVLSVFIPREGCERTDFTRANASDFISTLRHSMTFGKTKGLAATAAPDAGALVDA